MAYAMTKKGSLDNCITYEFICDTITDMNAIENRYRTIGSVAIVLSGESEGLEVYIAGSDKQWNSLSGAGASGAGTGGGLSIYVCSQDEVSNGLPNISEPDESTIYLVASGSETNDLFAEYIYVNEAWEKFGANVTIDLSSYATKSEIPDVSGLAPKDSPVFTGSINMGRKANTTIGPGSIALGTDVTASGSYSYAQGSNTTASESGAHAEGQNTKASGANAHAEGYNTSAIGTISHVEGSDTKASNVAAHAEGYGGTYTKNNVTYTSEAKGMSDHTEGYQCRTATGQPGNHAEGYQTAATGGASHAEGDGTIASNSAAHAEGRNTTASGYISHAEGDGTAATSPYSHAEGNSTQAYGTASHAEGAYTLADGYGSHAEGSNTRATGVYSHAEGLYTEANSTGSRACGMYNVIDSWDNWPAWKAYSSYVVGDKVKVTTTVNNETTVKGYVCKANHASTNVFQNTNWDQDNWRNYVEIIGNGTPSARSNARALGWDGSEYLGGDLYVNCNSDSTGGTKVITASEIPNYLPEPLVFTRAIPTGGTLIDLGSHMPSGSAYQISSDIWANFVEGPAILYINDQEYEITLTYSSTQYTGYSHAYYAYGTSSDDLYFECMAMFNSTGTLQSTLYLMFDDKINTYDTAPALKIKVGVNYIHELYTEDSSFYVGATSSTEGNKVATEAFVTTRVPAPPVADGTYNLQVSVSSGVATYSWVAAPASASGVSF